MHRIAKAFLTLALLTSFVGCCDEPIPAPVMSPSYSSHYRAQGHVRSLYQNNYDGIVATAVVIEGDNGVIFTVMVCRRHSVAPPVWPGLHGIFTYDSDPNWDGGYINFQVEQRLP